jgi:hypothetical protein
MTTVPGNPGASVGPEGAPEENLLRDLATLLSEDRAAYLRLGPEAAVLTVKSPETFAFGETVDCNWIRMTPEARAKVVLGWIRRAAAYYRAPQIRYALQREDVA